MDAEVKDKAEDVAQSPWTKRLAEVGERFWLVTSDRELRERAGKSAARVFGGGCFARELTGR